MRPHRTCAESQRSRTTPRAFVPLTPVNEPFLLRMPTAPVDGSGTYLYFEDSGAPQGSLDYATLVLFHGAMFHSAVYSPLIPYASKYNLRLVLVNYRDYPGSTPFSPLELEAFTSSNKAVQAAIIQANGLEILEFVRWLATTENLPKLASRPDGSTAGGVAVLAWSAGNMQLLSAVAHADKLSDNAKAQLAQYLRGVILYDVSSASVGAPAPVGVYTPFQDSTITIEEKVEQFKPWCTLYFTPAELLRPSAHTFEASGEHPFLPVLRSRVALGSARGAPLDTPDRFAPTALRMGTETLDALTDEEAMFRSQILYFGVDLTIYQENLRRALFPAAHVESGKDITWPMLPIHHIWCDMSLGDTVWGAQSLLDFYASHKGDPEGRPFKMHRLEEANHFIHWDEPERFLKFLANII